MAAECSEKWLRSKKMANIDNQRLRPRKHPRFLQVPLSVQKGQAEVYWLESQDGHPWLVKIFRVGMCPGQDYLNAISTLLPANKAFSTATERKVLTGKSLIKSNGSYYSRECSRWLTGGILMPKAEGQDWASVADLLRNGTLHLSKEQRWALVKNISILIQLLEKHGISHRDLSNGNVFIDITTLSISFIDFDCLYHRTLHMPDATTCGSEGYIPAFIFQAGVPEAKRSWCDHADRFALTIINIEFLLLDSNAPFTGDGGMFLQEELRNRKGKGLVRIIKDLARDYPQAVPLLKKTLTSQNFEDCPRPQEWIDICAARNTISDSFTLDNIEMVSIDHFRKILQKVKRHPPVWPAPRLDDMPLDFSDTPKKLNSIRNKKKCIQSPQSSHFYHQVIATPRQFYTGSKRPIYVTNHLAVQSYSFRKKSEKVAIQDSSLKETIMIVIAVAIAIIIAFCFMRFQ